jgi:hypothetical protein
MSQKRGRRYKNQPALYDDLKRSLDLTLTPTGKKGLEQRAREWNLSKSELIERIGRGIIPLPSPQEVERMGEYSIKKMPSSDTNSASEGISNDSRKPKEVQALINSALGLKARY